MKVTLVDKHSEVLYEWDVIEDIPDDYDPEDIDDDSLDDKIIISSLKAFQKLYNIGEVESKVLHYWKAGRR